MLRIRRGFEMESVALDCASLRMLRDGETNKRSACSSHRHLPPTWHHPIQSPNSSRHISGPAGQYGSGKIQATPSPKKRAKNTKPLVSSFRSPLAPRMQGLAG